MSTTASTLTSDAIATGKPISRRIPLTRSFTLSVAGKLALIVLTAVYLILELALNTQVLGLVGKPVDRDELENVQIAGHFLTALAIGLLVLHLLLRMRNHSKQRVGDARPDAISMVLYGLLAVSCMFSFVRANIDEFVQDRSAEFRKQALSIRLMQSATASKLVTWKSQDNTALFDDAAGKTFLAFYPFMTAARTTLAEEVQPLIKYQAKQSTIEQVGGISGYYEAYKKAINNASNYWKAINSHSSKKGQTLQQYLASKHIQESLRRTLHFPSNMQVPYVTTEAGFRTQVYEPLLAARVQTAVNMSTAPVSAFANGRTYSEEGEEAVMHVVLPPLLLMASLFGLLVHFALLVYLVTSLFLSPMQKLVKRPWTQRLTGPVLVLVPVMVVSLVWGVLNISSNTMTDSEPYKDMRKYLQADSPQNLPLTGLVDQSLHAITVAQGWLEPLGAAALHAVPPAIRPIKTASK